MRVVLPVLVARKNELPGDASVEGISPFEAWHGRRPQSHLLGINNAAIDHGQEAHPRFGDEWRRLRAITERIDRVLLEARSRKVVTDALRKSVKPAREYTPGDDFWFYTEKGSKVKVSGWKGPARLLQVEKRIAVLRYNGRFYERSVDDIKPFCPPHGDPAAAAALQASRADRAAETAQLSATHSVSSHALLRSVLHRLQRNRPVHAQTAEMLERHFGRRFLGAQLAKNPLRYQGLRNVAFSQLGSRVTVLFDAQGRELWRHEDAGAPMRRAIPMSPHLAPTIHAQVALFFRPGSVGTPLDESDDDEKKQSVGAGENTADVTEDDSSLDDQHDLEPPTSPSPPPVDIPDSVEPPTQEDMTMEVAPPPPADDEPTTPPGYTAEYDPPTVTIIGEEPSPSTNTPPPTGNHPEMFSIATPGDSPDHAEDDDGDEQGDADDFEDAQETHEQDATPTPSERPEEAHVEPQPPTAFAPSYGPARVPPPSQAPQRRSSRLNKDLQTSPLKEIVDHRISSLTTQVQAAGEKEKLEERFESNAFYVNGEKFLNEREEDVYLTMKQIKPRERPSSGCNTPEWDMSRWREWRSWIENDVYERIPRSEIPAGMKTLTTRWVYTRKDDGTAKSRLTVRGDVETRRQKRAGAEQLPTDSPTMTRLAFRVFFCIAAMMNWHIASFDVPTAFLQQSPEFMDSRQQGIYLEIPEACRERDDDGRYVWRCKKSPYGVSDAPRAWFATFSAWIREQGGVPMSQDPCTFKFEDRAGNLVGQLGVHVDDGILSGTPEFMHYMTEQLKTRWQIQHPMHDSFKFCGVWVNRQADGVITLSQEQYAEMVEPISVKRSRMADRNDSLTPQEVHEIQSVCGAAMWLTTQTRPDLAFATSELIGKVAHDKNVECLSLANKLVKKIHHGKANCLVYRPLAGGLTSLRMKIFSDASLGNMPGMKSQSGQLFALSTVKETGTFTANVIHWRSNRIKRVVRSTFAAETLSAVDAADHGVAARAMIQEWVNSSPDSIPIELFTDCRSLKDASDAIAPRALEKRLEMDLISLKEVLSEGLIACITWIPTALQIADALTKNMDTSQLCDAAEYGIFVTKADETAHPTTHKLTETQHRLKAMLCLIGDQLDVYG